jgi:type II protein arginine methyltransferase
VVAGKRVLDIGTGSGLRAMMAARAGAAHVYACEAKPILAATARETIAKNSLSDKITVFAKHSGELDRKHDLVGGAEIAVSEIFSQTLLGEKVLPALRQARTKLCAPGALFLPQQASIRVALADVSKPPKPLDLIEGFDVSRFSRHLQPTHHFKSPNQDVNPRSLASDLFRFDFCAEPPSLGRKRISLVSTGGRVNAIAQWICINMTPGITYENAPAPDQSSHWALVVTPLAEPRETMAREQIEIGGWQDETTVLVWDEARAL